MVTIDNPESRRCELAQTLDDAVRSKVLKRMDALRLRGRMQFAAGQLYGLVAQRCLAIVTQHAYGAESSNVSDAAVKALVRFRDMLMDGNPRVISSRSSMCWQLFTDASHEPQASTPFAGVGAVLVDGIGNNKLRFFSEELSEDLLKWINVGRRKTIIFECEFFAFLCAFGDLERSVVSLQCRFTH